MRKFMTGLALAIYALGLAPSPIVGTGAAPRKPSLREARPSQG